MFTCVHKREVPIKITLSYYFSPINLAKVQKFDNCWQGCEEIGTHMWLVGTQNGTTPVEENLLISNKTA